MMTCMQQVEVICVYREINNVVDYLAKKDSPLHLQRGSQDLNAFVLCNILNNANFHFVWDTCPIWLQDVLAKTRIALFGM